MVVVVSHGNVVARPEGKGFGVIADGAVALAGDRIVAVGSAKDVERLYGEGDEHVDASGCIIAPGFVDAHTHVAGSCFRGLLEDISDHFYGYALRLEEYMTSEMVYAFSLLGAVEALRFGVTTVNDHYHMGRTVAQAALDSGIGAVVAHTVMDVHLGEIGLRGYIRDPRLGEETLREAIALIERPPLQQGTRVRYALGPHATDTCSTSLLSTIREESTRLGVGVHMHVAQSEREVRQVAKEHSATPVSLLEKTGLLKPGFLAAHLVNAGATDIAKVASSGASSAYCPVVYAKNGRLPNVSTLLSSGVKIGLGTDWLSMNPWDMMRQMVAQTRVAAGRTALNAPKTLYMATLGAAHALGLSKEVGSIEPGKRADLIVIDAASAHMKPLRNNIQNMVYYAEGGDVRHVFVAGKTVVRDRALTTVDEKQVVHRAQALAEELWSRLPYPSE
ncbi:MAG: amidohydrolase family protein [Thermoprotei archaeon]